MRADRAQGRFEGGGGKERVDGCQMTSFEFHSVTFYEQRYGQWTPDRRRYTDRQTDRQTGQDRQTNALDNLLDCYKCTEIGRGVTNVVQGKPN